MAVQPARKLKTATLITAPHIRLRNIFEMTTHESAPNLAEAVYRH
jgi:hypothetical protein